MPRGRQSQQAASSSQASTRSSQRQMPASSQAQSQVPPSQAEKNAERLVANMIPGEVQKKVDELVHYLLIVDQKKVPIKKLDINKMILKENSKAFPELMKRASEQLFNIFGIQVVELQDRLKGSYILINALEKSSEVLKWPDCDNAKMGLVMTILSIIYMSGNVMQEGELWTSLKKFGIEPELQHETFGDVKKLVTQEFARQGYLEFTKLPNTDQPMSEVRWGQRAQLETTKKRVLKFVSFMYNREPKEWTSQYQDAGEETMETA